MSRKKKLLRLPRLESLERRDLLATLTVDSLLDTVDANPGDAICDDGGGNCTLRAAIEEANALAGTDDIEFNIGGGGAQTIPIATPLPSITESVTIDGSTQPAVTEITIDASALGSSDTTITVSSGTAQLEHLDITGASGTGIAIDGGSGHLISEIDVSWSGPTPTGTGIQLGAASSGNTVQNVTGTNRDVGLFNLGTSISLIQLNDFSGADLAITSGNLGQGNRYFNNDLSDSTTSIGISGDRSFEISGNDFSNSFTGVNLSSIDGSLAPGGQLTISPAPGPGQLDIDVSMVQNAVDIRFSNDLLITDAPSMPMDLSWSGGSPTGLGFRIQASSDNVIQNVIATNRSQGVETNTADNHTFQNNDFSGAGAFGIRSSVSQGVRFFGNDLSNAGSYALVIDRDRSFEVSGNLFAGSANGVTLGQIDGSLAPGGQLIVSPAAGPGQLDIDVSDVAGIAVALSSDHVTLTDSQALDLSYGGITPTGPAVRIAGSNNVVERVTSTNRRSGVEVVSGTGNVFRENSFFANTGLGIDLGTDGVTPNDPLDPDTGANELQNFPTITAVEAGATTRIAGTLNSLPKTSFTLHFYANTVADPSGFGEGERYLGETTVMSNGSGDASFDVVIPSATTLGEFVTATATGPDGTSEFSAGLLVQSTIVTSGADSGPGTLREALASALSGEMITFDPAVTAVTLTSGELVIPTGVTISGPALSFTHPSPTDCGTATTATGGVTITQTSPGSRVIKIDDPTNDPATPASSFADVTLENLMITGGSTDSEIFDDADGAGIFSLENLTLENVFITGNTADQTTGSANADGGGLSQGNEFNAAGDLVIDNSVLEFNTAIDDASAFDHYNANDLTITDSRVRCNTTGDATGAAESPIYNGTARVVDGIGFLSPESVTITNSYFSGNRVDAASSAANPSPLITGGLTISAPESGWEVTIEDSTFSGNFHSVTDSYDADSVTPDGRGGALFLRSVNATISNSTFSGNESYGSGGAITVQNDVYGASYTATVTLTNTTITGNTTCQYGGGLHIYAESGTVPPEVFIFDSVISNNAATGCPSARPNARLQPGMGRGGGVSAVSKSVNLIRLEIDPTTISNNTAADVGGGLYLRDVDTLLEETTVTGNTATFGGGGIEVYGDAGGATASLEVLNSTISNNSATANSPAAGGGGIGAGGGSLGDVTVSVVQSTLSGNSAAGDGGGIEVNDISSLSVQRSLLSSNLAAGSGGSISITDTATLIENATISGNSATGDGGGIWKSGTPITEVAFSTLTLNSATDGGGIFNANGPFDLNNTIVSDNSATGTGADFYDPMGTATITYSLIEDPTGNTAGMDMSNIVSMSAMLGPLMDQGGITLTHRPMEGSPAIGVADFGAAPPSDQRGYSRPGGTRDLGALETDGVLDADFTEDGLFDCDDIDALTTAVVNGGILALFDLNADAMLDITDVDLWRTEAGAVNLTSGNAYLVGDANLDGVVDGFDLLIWNANKFTANPRWCSGDFNVDGFVNGSDYILWLLNKFTDADPPPPIPTPVGPPGHKAVARLDKQSEVPADPPIPTISSLPLQPQLPSAPQHKKLFDFRNDVTAEWRNASDELMASDMDWMVDLPSFISKPIARFT